eukprot:TRINITY_DN10532_c0_g1_i2.p1 TRINITY_DN10532_c0_g1~~TRINITY_DN10532_c0_g1_i2.p1  ORF type:complete len:851 (-),score=145.04 TRINITY_DN10532_c0_g1_i2:46-2598(-)
MACEACRKERGRLVGSNFAELLDGLVEEHSRLRWDALTLQQEVAGLRQQHNVGPASEDALVNYANLKDTLGTSSHDTQTKTPSDIAPGSVVALPLHRERLDGDVGLPSCSKTADGLGVIYIKKNLPTRAESPEVQEPEKAGEESSDSSRSSRSSRSQRSQFKTYVQRALAKERNRTSNYPPTFELRTSDDMPSRERIRTPDPPALELRISDDMPLREPDSGSVSKSSWCVTQSDRLPIHPWCERPTLAAQRSKDEILDEDEPSDDPPPQLLPYWDSAPGWERSLTPDKSMSLGYRRSRTWVVEGVPRGGDSLRESSCAQRFVIGPNAKTRAAWDLISVVILAYDIFTVPLMVFDIPESTLIAVLNMVCTVFWTLDIIVSFLSGYHMDGLVELRPSQIGRRYVRTWFTFDIIIILLDWAMYLTGTGLAGVVGVLRISKVLRIGRLLRLVRLLRVVKMPRFFEALSEWMHSEALYTGFGVMRSLFIIASANHFIACGWYAVGQEGEPSWVDVFDREGRGTPYRYATSLHWSLTQFTPAGMEVSPRNTLERVYALATVFVALLVFSSFVSSITSAMNRLNDLNKAAGKQRNDLRKFISDNRLSLELGNSIVAFARQRTMAGATRRVHQDQIDTFKVLPESLKHRLHWEVYAPITKVHPLFYHYVEFCEGFFLELCNEALAEKSLSTSQELFHAGEQASKMYFMIDGFLEYFHGKSDVETAVVKNHQWFSEAVLWVDWLRKGRIAAVCHCEFAELDASQFRRIMSYHPHIFPVSKIYAVAFQRTIAELPADQLTDVWAAGEIDIMLEMAQGAFNDYTSNGRADETKAGTVWRQWHSFALIRQWTAPHFSKSNTL